MISHTQSYGHSDSWLFFSPIGSFDLGAYIKDPVSGESFFWEDCSLSFFSELDGNLTVCSFRYYLLAYFFGHFF